MRSVSRLNVAFTPLFSAVAVAAPGFATGPTQKRKAPHSKQAVDAVAASQFSLLFTAPSEMEAFAEEIVAEAPSAVSTAAFIKAIQV